MRSSIDGFRLRWRALGPDDKLIGEFVLVDNEWPPETHQATIKWLKGGHHYVFEVVAFNDTGEGDWSDPSEPFEMPGAHTCVSDRSIDPNGLVNGSAGVHTRGFPLESQPFMGLSRSSDTIDIAWDPPCHRGAPIVGYDVLLSKDPHFGSEGTRELTVSGETTKMVVHDLEPNTTYYFKHRARNEVGASKWSATSDGIATISQPPQQPLPPLRIGDEKTWEPTEITIKWNPPESYGIPIQHYRVRVGTDSSMTECKELGVGPLGLLASAPSPHQKSLTQRSPRRQKTDRTNCSQTKLKIQHLRPASDYYFQLKAINQIGDSPWSEPSVAMRTAVSAPARCGQARFVDGSVKEGIRMSWEEPNSYGFPITRYDIRVSQAAMMDLTIGSNVRVVLDVKFVRTARPRGPAIVETTATGCYPPGVDQYYQIRAGTDAGVGEWSPVSAPMQVPPDRPHAPKPPEHFTPLPRAIVVSWEPPYSPGAPVIAYRLRYCTNNQMKDPLEVLGMKGGNTEMAVTGLVPHNSYFFQVAGINSVGCSPWSVVSQPMRVLHTPPLKMGSPFLLSRTQNSITAGFQTPADHGTHDGDMISSYTLLYTLKECLAVKQHTVSPDWRSSSPRHAQSAPPNEAGDEVRCIPDARPEATVIQGLRPGKPIHVCVKGLNEFGESVPSDVATFFTAPAAPDPPPPPVQSETTPWTIALAISPGDDNGSKITHYSIHWQRVSTREEHQLGPVGVCHTKGDVVLHFIVDALHPGAEYCFKVAAINDIGRSEWSASTVPFRTAPSVPDKVENLQVSDITSRRFSLEWEEPDDNGLSISGYVVVRTCDGKEREDHRTSRSILCDNCCQGKMAFARVAAQNALGTGPFSNDVVVQMHPGEPFKLIRPTATDISYTSLRLKWGTCYDGASRVLGHRIYFEEVATEREDLPAGYQPDEGETTITTTRRSCFLVNMRPRCTYVFRVAAYNEHGTAPCSENSLPVRLMDPAPPDAPSAASFVLATVTTLVLTIQPGENNGAEIIEHVFRLSTDPEMLPERCVEITVPGGTSSCTSSGEAPSPFITEAPPVAFEEDGLREERPALVLDVQGCKAGSGFELTGGFASTAAATGISALSATGLITLPSFGSGTWAPLTRMKKFTVPEEFHQLQPLEAGTGYYVCAASRNVAGLGAFGPISDQMHTKKDRPMPIKKVEYIAFDHESITLRWDRPHCQGSSIIRYIIRCARTQDGLCSDSCPEYGLLVEQVENEDRPTYQIHGLLPGTHYWASVQCYNALGPSVWTFAKNSRRTAPMVPTKMDPLLALKERRTKSSVTFTWTLPDPRGSDVTRIDLKMCSREVEAGEVTANLLNSAPTAQLFPDPVTGEFTTQYTYDNLGPGMVVVCIARSLNGVGYSEWSDRQPKVGKDAPNITNPDVPTTPEAPRFDQSSTTPHGGDFTFRVGRCNGMLYSQFHYRLYAGMIGADWDELSCVPGWGVEAPWKEWTVDVTDEENDQVLRKDTLFRRHAGGLHPGTVYALQLRAWNGCGPSPWSEVGPAARTRPDKPVMNQPMGMEYTSPEHIVLRWHDIYHNGAPIEGYEVRWNVHGADLSHDEWFHINMAEVLDRWRAPRENSEGTGHTLDVNNLDAAVHHYFKFRGRNCCGWSEWSETSCFLTKPSPPARILTLQCEDIKSTEMTLSWDMPDSMGAPIERYDVSVSLGLQVMKIGRFISEWLWRKPQLDKIFGLSHLTDRGGVSAGVDALCDMESDENFVTCLPSETTSMIVPELIPGREYHVMIRAVSHAGAGKWSPVLTPLLTPPIAPRIATALIVEYVTKTECKLIFELPYDNGAPITEAVVKIHRAEGPLAHHDIDPDTGSVHDHHSLKTYPFDPFSCVVVDMFGAKGQERYSVVLGDMLPGTTYDVSWTLRNQCGCGPLAPYARFTTEPDLPDTPKTILHNAPVLP